jgi:SAM-dependent methyltransferase
MSDSMLVFDRALVRRRRDRAAGHFAAADFLFQNAGERLTDRLLDIARNFPLAIDLGCHTGALGSMLRNHSKIERLVQADLSPRMARTARHCNGLATLCCDEEWLPLAEASLDLALSNLSLQWVNDLPGALAQIRRALKADGLLLATVFGGETLRELRTVLMEAESEISGGASPRVSPFVDVREAGNLLTRAGFGLPVVDTDTLTVTYADMFKLMADLRAMGETNAVLARSKAPVSRALFLRAAALYAERFADARGRLVATFQIVTLTAWAPHASQQKPLRRGSAKARLADALKTNEVGLSDPVPFKRPS